MSHPVISDRVFNSVESSTVQIADKVKTLRESGKTVFDFSAGRAFEDTPSYVCDAAVAALNRGETHQTMARGTTEYRQACASKLARENNIIADPEKEIVATMGCKQGLTIALLTLLNPGDEVIVEDPCFVSYRQIIHYAGGRPVPVPLLPKNGFRWRREQLEAAITNKTKAIILCTPHNPTGTVHTYDDLEEVAVVARKYSLSVITDEPYERTVWKDRQHTNMATLPDMKNLCVTLMSLTKSFSMGGWRIGFNYAHEDLVNQMTKLQQHLITCVSSISQAGGVAAFGQPERDEVLTFRREWEDKVQFCTDALNKIDGLKCDMPEGGFYVWVDISEIDISSEDFANGLLDDQNVAVIPGEAFGEQGKDYFRFTCVKSWDEIKNGLSRIEKFIDKF